MSESKRRTYIFITGGVISSLGKGTIAASTSRILGDYGLKTTNVKCEMYVNIDSGTIRPTEHGEVFVTDDGLEADQDLGNYERFSGISMGRVNFMTTGQVYQTVIERERNLEYEGEDVEVVPHVPQEIIRRIKAAGEAADADVVIVEFGGTVGEYQLVLYLEAARMMEREMRDEVLHVHVSYLPIPSAIGEMKTKPAQYSVRTLNAAGIQPDILIGRSERAIDPVRREKLAAMSGLDVEDIFSSPDCESIYQVPLVLEEQGYGQRIVKKLNLPVSSTELSSHALAEAHAEWQQLVDTILDTRSQKDTRAVRIAIVGKYFKSGEFTLEDSYISVIEAIKHAAWSIGKHPSIQWVNSEAYEQDPSAVSELSQYDGVIIPGGYGSRGIEGKIVAIQYVREQHIPFLGICYGLQLAVVEFARHVVGLTQATTQEMDPHAAVPVIHTLEQTEAVLSGERSYGGTQRLGAYECELLDNTLAARLYKARRISERHRHRYEVNNTYRDQLEAAGMVVSGVNPELGLVEMIELPQHPYFIATQAHPEFLSQPLDPHPLFVGLVSATLSSDVSQK